MNKLTKMLSDFSAGHRPLPTIDELRAIAEVQDLMADALWSARMYVPANHLVRWNIDKALAAGAA